jgi:hypothetical protein
MDGRRGVVGEVLPEQAPAEMLTRCDPAPIRPPSP